MNNKNGFLAFIRVLTPTHVGVGGQAVSIIDLPIQREHHTKWPTIYGSSLKGALRDYAEKTLTNNTNGLENPIVKTVFGSSENMGSIIFGDAILLFYPVKSWDKIFVWITSPYALERYLNMLKLLGLCEESEIKDAISATKYFRGILENAGNNKAISLTQESKKSVNEKEKEESLYIEDIEYKIISSNDIQNNKEKIEKLLNDIKEALDIDFRNRLYMVSDQVFDSIVTTRSIVQARIQLNDLKTVQHGPWYEEYLPPETILYVPFLKNLRVKKKNREGRKDSEKHLAEWLKELSRGITFPVGGNETIGKGLVYMRTLRNASGGNI